MLGQEIIEATFISSKINTYFAFQKREEVKFLEKLFRHFA